MQVTNTLLRFAGAVRVNWSAIKPTEKKLQCRGGLITNFALSRSPAMMVTTRTDSDVYISRQDLSYYLSLPPEEQTRFIDDQHGRIPEVAIKDPEEVQIGTPAFNKITEELQIDSVLFSPDAWRESLPG